jgi:hypothetical protein
LARQLLAVAQNPTLAIGVGACCGPLDACYGAKSIGLFAIQRKSDRKKCILSPRFIVLLRGKSEGGTNDCRENTEQNMGLSVLVLKQVAASGELHGLHKAGTQFL